MPSKTSVHSNQVSQSQVLTEIKNAFKGFHDNIQAHISSSGTLTELAYATGSYIPSQSEHSPQVGLMDIQQAILLILAGVESMPAENIAKRLGVGQHVASTTLTSFTMPRWFRLTSRRMAHRSIGANAPGRDYLVERGLVK